MKKSIGPVLLLGAAALFAAGAMAQTPPEPGANPGVVLVNLTKNSPKAQAALPTIAVDLNNDNVVAVAWRRYGLPIDTNALKGVRVADCHISISKNGGRSFTDKNLMPVLRTEAVNGEPSMWYCSLPWTAIASDGTIYAGGSTFTAGGVVQVEPKQGRAAAVSSTNGGASFSKAVWAVSINQLGPGVKGLQGGTKPEDTPWDGSKGFVDPATGTVYVITGGGVAASTDKGKSFGNYYYLSAPGFTGTGRDAAASHGIVGSAVIATAAPDGAKCPCLTFVASRDNGATFAGHLVLQADGFSAQGRTHYPEIAADPAHEGHFAIVTFTPDHKSVQVSYTEDAGATWNTAKVGALPQGVWTISSADQPGVGYTADGRVLVAWRGQLNAGAYNVYAAMLKGNAFGPTVKLTPEPSIYPPLTYVGNYNPTSGGGDFWTSVTGNRSMAYIAFPYAPKGAVQDDWLARIPLAMMQ